MSVAHLKTWRIGRVEITRVVEVWKWEDDIGMALEGGTPAIVLAQPWLQPHHATPEGRIVLNALVAESGAAGTSLSHLRVRLSVTEVQLESAIAADVASGALVRAGDRLVARQAWEASREALVALVRAQHAAFVDEK